VSFSAEMVEKIFENVVYRFVLRVFVKYFCEELK